MESRNDSSMTKFPRKNRSARSAMLSKSRRKKNIINSSDRVNAPAMRFESSKVSRGLSG